MAEWICSDRFESIVKEFLKAFVIDNILTTIRLKRPKRGSLRCIRSRDYTCRTSYSLSDVAGVVPNNSKTRKWTLLSQSILLGSACVPSIVSMNGIVDNFGVMHIRNRTFIGLLSISRDCSHSGVMKLSRKFRKGYLSIANMLTEIKTQRDAVLWKPSHYCNWSGAA